MKWLENHFINECKLVLGDVYLMTGEIWEAALLYGQVDKANKDEPIGQLAKFKNAQLAYYTSEFEWAKSQLDILKSSTSQLIANDAINLSLIIADNTNLDSTSDALSLYAKADLFISIHCNSMPIYKKSVITGYHRNKKGKRVPTYTTVTSQSTSTSGVETFVSGFGRMDEQDIALRENASILLEEDYKDNYEGYDPKDPESIIMFSFLKNSFREQSIKLATFMQDEYAKTGRIDRGVKEKSLAVLARAGMPAVLTEIGFISNPEEEAYMNSETGQQEIVDCLFKAIQTYKRQLEVE